MRKTLFMMPFLFVSATLAVDNPIERWANAVGGRERVSAIRSIYREGTIEYGGLQVTLKVWHTADGKYRKEEQGGTYSLIETFDGVNGNVQQGNQPPHKMTGPELELATSRRFANANAMFFAFFPDRRRGTVAIEGDNTIVLKPEGGVEWRVMLDPQTSLPKTMVHKEGDLLLLVLLWRERNQSLELPTPTGPFAVGRATYDWTDDLHLDTLAPVPGTKRELLVWIWYPAAAGPSVVMDDYVPAQMRTAAGSARGVMPFLTRDVSKVHSHSARNPDVSPQQRSYPVVIMRAGASSEVWKYSTLAEDLVSHGYVVVGFDAPYRTSVVAFPDGRVMRRTPENNGELCEEKEQAQQADCANRLLTAWTADIGFVLDQLERLNTSDPSGKFTGRLDMTRVGVCGHSFGGATAAQFCHDDSRCKAGIDLDGQPFGSVIQAGLHQPFMFVLTAQIHSSDPETRQVLANIQSIYDRLPPDGRLRIEIRGANHFFFSDDGALLKSHILLRALRMLGVVRIEGPRQLAVTAYCVHSFFDAYLKGSGGSKELSSTLYPEIQVLK